MSRTIRTHAAPLKCTKCSSAQMTTGIHPDMTQQSSREQFNHATWFHRCLQCNHEVVVELISEKKVDALEAAHTLLSLANRIFELKASL